MPSDTRKPVTSDWWLSDNTATATEGLRPIGETVKPMMRRLQNIKRALDAD